MTKSNFEGQPVPNDQYQTVRELADRLEVSEASVRQWIKSGELRAIHIGKGWRVASIDLERFLKARETAPRERASAKAAVRADHSAPDSGCD